MKQALCAFLLFLASVPLSPQTRQDTFVYILDVTGGTVGERRFFADSLRTKIPAEGYTLTGDIFQADYALSCYITDNPEGEGRLLGCSLLDAKDEREIVSTALQYRAVEEAYEMLSDFITSLFAAAPLKSRAPERVVVQAQSPAPQGLAEPPDGWKYRWLFLNARAGLSSRYYLAASDTTPSASILTFDAGLEPELHIFNFLALQLGLNFSLDHAEYRLSSSNPTAIVYATSILSVPFMAKYIFNPSPLTTLAPFLGLYATVPLMGASRPPPLGALGGLDLSVKTALGVVLFDLRCSVDLGSSEVADSDIVYQRVFVTLSAGYKFGLLQR
jgi:hypothetical protein